MLGLFSTKTNPSNMFETLSKLQTKREGLANELDRIDNEISRLKANLNQILGNDQGLGTTQVTPAQHNQPLGTTQVTPAQHNRTPQQVMAQATNPLSTLRTVDSLAGDVIQSRLKPSSAPANSSTSGMAAIINDRAPYHTAEVQIVGVLTEGQIVMYKHYLSGDGISSGIPALENCNVTTKQSASGNIYRQMETPALKITCTLAQPLPTNFVEQKRAIREWLATNEYLTTSDPNKTPFECEYDAYGNMYTPYVSVDTKGLKLFIYIGCASMTSAKPCPTLIA